MSKHTPYHYDDNTVWDAEGNGICERPYEHGLISDEAWNTNARLIVESPTMLELLQSLENDNGSIPAGMWDRIKECISRATGTTQDDQPDGEPFGAKQNSNEPQ